MRRLFSYAVSAAMVILVFTAGAATNTPAKKKTAKKTVAARESASPGRKSPPASSLRRGTSTAHRGAAKKGTAKRTTSWRNRQMSPSPERYKEIQQALVAKGYLQPGDALGTWNQASIDAMKKFQSDQKLDSTGKINSLSLIALGLGPKHDSAPAKPAETPQEQPAK